MKLKNDLIVNKPQTFMKIHKNTYNKCKHKAHVFIQHCELKILLIGLVNLKKATIISYKFFDSEIIGYHNKYDLALKKLLIKIINTNKTTLIKNILLFCFCISIPAILLLSFIFATSM